MEAWAAPRLQEAVGWQSCDCHVTNGSDAPAMPAVPPTNVDPSTVESLHGNLKTLTLPAQPAGHWYTTVLQKDLSCWLRVPSHLQQKTGR